MAKYYYHADKDENEINWIKDKRYGEFRVNETRVVLIDTDRMWVPTKAYPIWGSREGVIGTVIGITDDLISLDIAWDNGARNVFNIRFLARYSLEKHGEPKVKIKPGPNTTFRIQKSYGKFK